MEKPVEWVSESRKEAYEVGEKTDKNPIVWDAAADSGLDVVI